MKSLKSFLFLTLLTLATVGCQKEKDNNDNNTQCVAGPGGNVTVVCYAKHNGVTLLNYDVHPDTAFIKYGATMLPGIAPSAYDTFFVGEAGEDHIHCKGLKCGNYFIYRTAYDSTTNTRYTGGISINITQTSGEIDTAINVN